MEIPLRGLTTTSTSTNAMTAGSSSGSGYSTSGVHQRSAYDEGLNEDEDEDVDAFIAANQSPNSDNGKMDTMIASTSINPTRRLFASFMIFGLLNNVLYVIILSAALDLVPPSTPKGLVAFVNIFPALLTKVGWPILSTGKIRYARRVGFCTAVSWLGIVTIALSSSLYPRLIGIALASLSSGLGELTFLQMTTTLPTASSSKTALGAWSSGTGLAGIAGAGIWWLLRGLGVKGGLGISSVLPLFFPITYNLLLPPFSLLSETDPSSSEYQPLSTDADPDGGRVRVRPSIYVTPPSNDILPRVSVSSTGIGSRRYKRPLSAFANDNNDDNNDDEDTFLGRERETTNLSLQDKMKLVRPLLLRYMLPLCLVYIEEYVINSGVAPTLVFPVPTSGIWSRLFKSPRDYYPFWSLSYQTFVFISRSSLSIGLPAIPRKYLFLPTLIQFIILTLLSFQAKSFIFSSWSSSSSPITIVFLLICLEGLCGGSSYVNTFYHVGREGINPNPNPNDEHEGEEEEEEENGRKDKLQREFRIGAVGASDSCGILLASLISMPLEIYLCNSQIEQGQTLCRDL